MEAAGWMELVLDAEAVLVQEWISRAPAYEDHKMDFAEAHIALRKQLPAGLDWKPPQVPRTFTALALDEVTDADQSMASRFRRRTVLRRDRHAVAGLGYVDAFTVSKHDSAAPNAATWPHYRFVVASLATGLRVVRVDIPCVRCFATGAGAGSCGFRDEMARETCGAGWLFQGGGRIELGTPSESLCAVRPQDARWHPWFDG